MLSRECLSSEWNIQRINARLVEVIFYKEIYIRINQTGFKLHIIHVILQKIFNLPRRSKRFLQIIVDSILIFGSFWLAMALRQDGLFTQINPKSWLVMSTVLPVTIFSFAHLGLYRAIVRFMAERAIVATVVGATISTLTMILTEYSLKLSIPRSVPLIYFCIFIIFVGATRLTMRVIHLSLRSPKRKTVVIYGAGEPGRLLYTSLKDSGTYQVSFFIDTNPDLQNTSVDGKLVMSPQKAASKIRHQKIRVALIAVSRERLAEQKKAVKDMVELGLDVRIVPEVKDLISKELNVEALQKVSVEELLGRDPVSPIQKLMRQTIQHKSILISGAGGSIGSEITRQVLSEHPARVVLFEVSEYALYSIVEEISEKCATKKIELVTVLGSITNEKLVKSVIEKNLIDTIFHAAAYKHVPIVEENASTAIENNVIGTWILAKSAGMLGVKNFTLVSTDKAVRPTNIMGATKRLAELIVQESADRYPRTKFCSVRFGNVLGSSGSVIPKFKKQIMLGGPITLTHPNITRYFMTIPEAAQLVIQASAMGAKGEVFVLDMGEPVLIVDLARTMCKLYGKELNLDEHEIASNDTIMIKWTGLRPGEKLYEELAIGSAQITTEHPRIMCERNHKKEPLPVEPIIQKLSQLTDSEKIANTLESLPLGYTKDRTHHKN